MSEPTNELLSFLTLINEYTDERVLPCYGKVKAVTKGIREVRRIGGKEKGKGKDGPDANPTPFLGSTQEGYLEGKSKGGKVRNVGLARRRDTPCVLCVYVEFRARRFNGRRLPTNANLFAMSGTTPYTKQRKQPYNATPTPPFFWLATLAAAVIFN